MSITMKRIVKLNILALFIERLDHKYFQRRISGKSRHYGCIIVEITPCNH